MRIDIADIIQSTVDFFLTPLSRLLRGAWQKLGLG